MTTANTARQYALTVKQDFVGGDTSVDIKLPYGAIVTGGFVCVTQAFGAFVADVGDAATGNRYLNDANLNVLGATSLAATGYVSDGANAKVTLTGGAAGTGKGFVVMTYLIDGRCNEIQTH